MAGSWGLDNISIHMSNEIWQSLVTHDAPGWILLCILTISLLYPLVHNILLNQSRIYAEKLSPDQRVVVLQHAIEAITLLFLFVPFTYTILSVFFQEQPLEDLANRFVALGVFMAIIMTMYMYEIATRFASLRPLVVAHHLCAYADGILTAFCLSTANVKAAFLLVYFITFEAIIFVGLVLYRLAPTHRYTCPTILTGMLVFGLSRPLQLVWVVGGLLATGFDNLVTWQLVLQLFLAVCFTGIQLYSLTIHYGLYKKAYRKRMTLKEEIGRGDDTYQASDKQSAQSDAGMSEESSQQNRNDEYEA